MNRDCNNPDDVITSLPFDGVDDEGNRYFEDSAITYIVRTDPFLVNCIGTESLSMYIASKSSRINQAMYKVKNGVRMSSEPVFQNPFDGNSYFDKSLLVYKDRNMLYMYQTDMCEVGYGEELVRGGEKPVYTLIPFRINRPSILGLSSKKKNVLIDYLKGVNVAENEQKVLEVLRRDPEYVQKEEVDLVNANRQRAEWVPPVGGNMIDAVNADIDERFNFMREDLIELQADYEVSNSDVQTIQVPAETRILNVTNCPNLTEIPFVPGLSIIRLRNCASIRTIDARNNLSALYVSRCNELDFSGEWVNHLHGKLMCETMRLQPVLFKSDTLSQLYIRNISNLTGIDCHSLIALFVDNCEFNADKVTIDTPNAHGFLLRQCNVNEIIITEQVNDEGGEIIECPALTRVGVVNLEGVEDISTALMDAGYNILYY
jgi:hypothetical protein